MTCIFCQMAAGHQEVELLMQNEQLIVINDLYPKAPVHQLIIPRQHIANMNDVTEKETLLMGEMLLVAKKMAKKSGIEHSGYRLVLNCGSDGGQEIDHLHLHLLGGLRL